MISLEEQLKYLNIKQDDETYMRSLKLISHSFSFYIIVFTILSFLFEINPKIKLFLIVLLIINALIGSMVVHGKIERIKKLLLIENNNKIFLYEKLFHITIIIAMILFFKLPKINKLDILYSIIACFLLLNIYLRIFKAQTIYMDFIPENKGLILYVLLVFSAYIGIYFYTNI